MPPDRARLGIEKIAAYPCTLSLDLEELARARGHDPADLRDNLLVRRRSLNPLWEDPVTMAVNAAEPMLSEEDRGRIELLIVATESGVDQGKALSTFVQRHLRIQQNCRNYEAKHACYGGTSALMMACHWLASGLAGDAKALVIATDQSRCHLGKPYEYVMGAGAVAMLLGHDPAVLEIELEKNGFWTQEVSDTFRPTSRVETGNGEASLYCYLDALEGAYAHYARRAGPHDLDAYFKKHIYHVPFGGITFQAHRTLLRSWRRLKKSEALEHFQRKSQPALRYCSEMGGTYSGSTFIALMGLMDSCDDLAPGDRIAFYAYGSGSCGEFWSGLVGARAREVVAAARMQELVDARQPLAVPDYEALEQERFRLIDCGDFEPALDGFGLPAAASATRGPNSAQSGDLYRRRYAAGRLLRLRSIRDHYREYGWSEA
jgi:hydroxymethylglutaryl-CoA synthase